MKGKRVWGISEPCIAVKRIGESTSALEATFVSSAVLVDRKGCNIDRDEGSSISLLARFELLPNNFGSCAGSIGSTTANCGSSFFLQQAH